MSYAILLTCSTITLNLKISEGVKQYMINETYTVDILVNDKPVRKYPHNDKLFVEARKGESYSIRIKNNSYSRILAITSIDGLDSLTGQKADENGNGYVINGCNSLNIDGFRISNEKVARFLFDYKGGSYAASKEDGSEHNVGVIGIRLFTELVKPLPPRPIVVKEEHHHHHHHDHYPTYPKYPNYPWDLPTIWGNGGHYGGTGDFYEATLNNSTVTSKGGPAMDCCDYSATLSEPKRKMFSAGRQTALHSMNCSNQVETKGFDMGTAWGNAKESRVIEVEFEKGILALTTNIYYASRQSLIEMDVPITNEKQVSFPEPFSGTKYATPPSGWNG